MDAPAHMPQPAADSPPVVADPPRYCRSCGYSLHGLRDPRCPECGAAFDPADPRTFLTCPRKSWGARAIGLLPLVLPLLGFLGVAKDCESLVVTLVFLAVHLFIVSLPTVPIVALGYRRARWQAWDLVALVLPFQVWSGCDILYPRNSSLLGFLWITAATPLAALVRVAVGHHAPRWLVSILLIVALAGVAIAAYILSPPNDWR